MVDLLLGEVRHSRQDEKRNPKEILFYRPSDETLHKNLIDLLQ